MNEVRQIQASDDLAAFEARVTSCRLCAGRFAATATAHAPRPVAWLSATAPILISGQAPGMRVHKSGLPFDDASGDRLRDWLGVDRASFYDRDRFAVMPMAFCFPGYDAKGADLPPPKVCADTWRAEALALMPHVRLTLLVGGYAQGWTLGTRSVTAAVADWRARLPEVVPLPHPSWRNGGWLKKNPDFEAETLPWLRERVAELLGT
ncbi:MAG: uracil-DNA glycosylase family protein [Pseudomonadota bacterium]